MLVRDLTLSGCVDSVRLIPRADVPRRMVNSTGDEMRTDGVLTVVHLKDCNNPATQYSRANPLIPIRPRSRFVRHLRNEVLLYKSDVIRANILYGAFDLCRMGIQSFRHHHGNVTNNAENSLPLSPVSPETLLLQLEQTNLAFRHDPRGAGDSSPDLDGWKTNLTAFRAP